MPLFKTYPNHKYAVATTLLLFLVIAFLPSANAQFYNGSYQDFGKNRLQYKEFVWSYYDYKKYKIYFYTGGKNIATYTAKSTDDIIKDLEKLFDHYLEKKIDIIVYNKIDDFRQSNVGLNEDDEYNIGGVTRLTGSKLFVYFEGDHNKLKRQIRSGVSRIVVNQLMYGDNWKEMVKNSTLLTLPEWYLEGLISYSSEAWSVETDNKVRDGVMSGRFEKFNHLTGEDAKFAGHALWNYIAEVYGTKVISNLLYMSRISRNIESGFLFVLGVSLNTLTYESMKYYQNKYRLGEEEKSMPETNDLQVKEKSGKVYSQLKISPDEKFAAFATNELGKVNVWLYDFEQNQVKRIYRKGHKLDRITDYTYPLIDWHPNGNILTFIVEDEAEIFLNFYTIKTGEIRSKEVFNMEKVLSFSYYPEGSKMLFSGIKDGQSDIFVYKVGGGTYEPVTQDLYDDLNPVVLENGGVIFSSNRTDDTLRIDPEVKTPIENSFDLFMFQPASQDRTILRRLTNTPDINEVKPQPIYNGFSKGEFAFLSDENGILNRYIGQFDSAISHIDTIFHYNHYTKTQPVTNYPRNIEEHTFSRTNGKYSQIIYKDGKYQLDIATLEEDAVLEFENLQNTPYRIKKAKISNSDTAQTGNDSLNKIDYKKVDSEDEEQDPTDIDIDNYQFEGEEIKKDTSELTKDRSRFITLTSEGEDDLEEDFYIPKQRNYNISFTASDIISQMDFNYSTELYQRYNGGPYISPGMGAVVKVRLLDLFENYMIEGGTRYALNNKSTEYFLSLANRKKRLDKEYAFQRQVITTAGRNAFTFRKIRTHQGKYILTYPFSEVAAIKTTASLRNDHILPLSTDAVSLHEPEVYNIWSGLKLEYIFDNTLPIGLNLYEGMRYKIFAEYYNEFGDNGGNINILGMDFRHYFKIHRNIIWANRLAGSTSFGKRKLVYYLGAVDNWVVLSDRPKFNNENSPDNTQNYYFQARATNLRGFIENERNGNSFLLLNSEVRFPLFSYFINRPIKSDFIANFQVIGFGDVGTAWTGRDPYSDENSFNTKVIEQEPVKVILRNQEEPIIGSYGLGVRSKLLGYYVRIDHGWGVEDGNVRKPLTQLSLGLDF